MTEETTVRTATLELGGGAVLHVSRFTDPIGRDRLTLVRGFEDAFPIPTASEDVLELPGDATDDLVAALRELET